MNGASGGYEKTGDPGLSCHVVAEEPSGWSSASLNSDLVEKLQTTEISQHRSAMTPSIVKGFDMK